jgi:hypothetical protein
MRASRAQRRDLLIHYFSWKIKLIEYRRESRKANLSASKPLDSTYGPVIGPDRRRARAGGGAVVSSYSLACAAGVK